MNYSIFIAIGFAVVVFLFVMLASIRAYGKQAKDSEDWLFADFNKHVYQILYGNRDPKEVAVSLNLKVDQFIRDCEVARVKPDIMNWVVVYGYGLIALIIGVILAIFVNVVFLVFGLLLAFLLCSFEQTQIHNIAVDKKAQIENELPRFLDLLLSELEIGMPIEVAISVLCDNMAEDVLLAREFLDAMNETKLGASQWTETLTALAEKYDSDMLSSLVSNVVTSFERGVDMKEVVRLQEKEIRNTHVLTIKERAGKVTNVVLLPITVFQLAPMIVFLILPAIVSLWEM